jgi:hypothetical protein
MTRSWPLAAAAVALLVNSGCASPRMKVRLEVFLISLVKDGDAVQYAKRSTDLSGRSVDPDSAARELIQGHGATALLHSTSWRWEMDGTIVLSYLAYFEQADFRGLETRQVNWSEFAPPPATDPQRPRPREIREQDVLAHGLRHLSFLLRHARDGRLAASLSPRSLEFFRTMCGQLAGRLETASEFEECAAR